MNKKQILFMLLPYLIISAVVLFIGSFFLRYPLYVDEGTFLTLSQGFLKGHLPYRDVFDNKPPLLYIFLLPAVLISGQDIQMLHLCAFGGFYLISMLLLYQLLIPFGRQKALILTVFWIVFSFNLSGYAGSNLMSETVALPFLIAFYGILFNHASGRRRDLLLGTFAAVCMLINQHCFFVIIPLISESIQKRKISLDILLGGAAVSLPVIAYLLVTQSLNASIFAMFIEPMRFNLSSAPVDTISFVVFSIIAILLAQLTPKKLHYYLLWFWPGFLLLQLDNGFSLAGRKGILILPALLPYLALALSYPIVLVNRRFRLLVKVSAVLICTFLLIRIVIQTSVLDRDEEMGAILTYDQQIKVRDYFGSATDPESSLFVFPRNVELYYLTQKTPVTYYVHFYRAYLWLMQEYPENAEEFILKYLDAEPPDYIIFNTNDSNAKDYSGIAQFIADNPYVLVRDFRGLEIYKYVQPSPCLLYTSPSPRD